MKRVKIATYFKAFLYDYTTQQKPCQFLLEGNDFLVTKINGRWINEGFVVYFSNMFSSSHQLTLKPHHEKSLFGPFSGQIQFEVMVSTWLDCKGKSFKDYSWIQDFEADFPASKYWIRQMIRSNMKLDVLKAYNSYFKFKV